MALGASHTCPWKCWSCAHPSSPGAFSLPTPSFSHHLDIPNRPDTPVAVSNITSFPAPLAITIALEGHASRPATPATSFSPLLDIPNRPVTPVTLSKNTNFSTPPEIPITLECHFNRPPAPVTPAFDQLVTPVTSPPSLAKAWAASKLYRPVLIEPRPPTLAEAWAASKLYRPVLLERPKISLTEAWSASKLYRPILLERPKPSLAEAWFASKLYRPILLELSSPSVAVLVKSSSAVATFPLRRTRPAKSGVAFVATVIVQSTPSRHNHRKRASRTKDPPAVSKAADSPPVVHKAADRRLVPPAQMSGPASDAPQPWTNGALTPSLRLALPPKKSRRQMNLLFVPASHGLMCVCPFRFHNYCNHYH